VTLAGESAGAFSVITHLVSPPSANLLHGAVAMSGSPVRLPGTDTTLAPGVARRVATDLASELGCPQGTDEEVVACLRERPWQDILAADWIFSNSSSGAVQTRRPFMWTVDAGFAEQPALPQLQEEALARGDFLRVPLLIGVTRDEGLYNAATYILDPEALAHLDQYGDHIGPKIVFDKKTNVTAEEHEIVAKIRQFYFGDGAIDESQLQALVNMFSDKTFWSSVQRTVSLVAGQASPPPVFLYQFSHPGIWGFGSLLGLPPDAGVCHADDVHYLFQPHAEEAPVPSLGAGDLAVRDLMVGLWAAFVAGGDPTPGAGLQWDQYRPDSPRYLRLDAEPAMHWAEDWAARTHFWDTLFPGRVLGDSCQAGSGDGGAGREGREEGL
jgi:carboxylesterase type B